MCAILALAGLLAAFGAVDPAPRFNAKTLDGEKFNNENIRGKVVLLQFWATWCRYCRSDESAVNSITREFADKGLIVLAVNAGESKRKVKDYLSRSPRACKIVLMEDTNLAAMYAAKSYPIYVLIDREGNIAGIQKGAGGEKLLRRFLTRAGLNSE